MAYDRYHPLVEDFNMGPFLVLVDGNTGAVGGELHEEGTGLTLYRKVGPHFFANAKAANKVVRRVTIQLIGSEVTE